MSLYDLPQFNFQKKIKVFSKPRTTSQKNGSHKQNMQKVVRGKSRKKIHSPIPLVIFLSVLFGFSAGAISSGFFYFQITDYLEKLNILPQLSQGQIIEQGTDNGYFSQISQEEAVIRVVKEASPAVVTIVVSKDLPVFEEYYEEFFGLQYRQKGTEKREIGGGTGFIVSKEGLVLTNKHVVLDEEAEYTIFTNDGRKFSAKVLARDPFQDLAVMEIEQEKIVNNEGEVISKPFPVIKLGNSDQLQSGQTVIAIGNVLGKFRNTVSVGVISGLGRKITAAGGGFVETLEDVIQTDAAINKGNSGGPLLNLKGEVVGINTAMASGAQSIGFAIPINKAEKDIEQVKTLGKIVYPFLGIRYVLINEEVKKENNLSVDYGVLIIKGGEEQLAIWPDSAAEKAGLREGDILLEFNNEKITIENTLVKVIMKYNPGDDVVLKILRGEEEIIVEVALGERSE